MSSGGSGTLRFLLRGLLWRRQVSAVILVAALITIGAAALGPLYARAAAESTLHDQLVEAGWASGLEFSMATGPQSLGVTAGGFAKAAAEAPAPSAVTGFPTRVAGMSLGTGAVVDGVSVVTDLVWRSGACAQLVLVHGRCPTRAGEIVVSERTVTSGYGWALGKTVQLSAAGRTATIVGTYRARNTQANYWFGHGYFNAAPGGQSGPDRVDAVFASRAEFAALAPDTTVAGYLDYPVSADGIRLADVPTVLAQVARVRAHYADATEFVLTSGITATVHAAERQRTLIDSGALLVTAELGLLGWLVLFQIVTDAIEARGPEIALAKLRGQGRGAVLVFGLSEILLLLLVAAPLGVLGAWAGTRLFAGAALAPGTPVLLTWGPFLAMLAALAGGLVAAALAARRVLTRPVLEQWRRTTGHPRSAPARAALDVLVAVAALALFVVLRVRGASTGDASTLTLLAPGLLVTAVALLGTRMLPVLVRRSLPFTRATTRHIGLFLASRQVARRPAGLRLAALLTVAVGLASFGVGGEAVASANRQARADAELGASRVASLQYSSAVDPVAAVRRADPDGTWAMAAATWLPDGGDSVAGTVVGVDASRLAAVGAPAAGGPSLATLARTLAATTVPAITVRATRIRVTIAGSELSRLRPRVQFALTGPRGGDILATAGRLRAGTHTYTAAIHCSAGCTFTGLAWERPVGTFARMAGSVLVTRLAASGGAVFRPLAAALSTPGGWRAAAASGEARDTATTTAVGLRDVFTSRNGGYGGLDYASVPSPIPAVATHAAIVSATLPAGGPQLVDSFGSTADFTVSRWAGVLPAALNDGVLMNVAFLDAALPAFADEASWQVWLAPSAPADAVARLRAQGLTVQSTSTVAARVTILARQGPALSLRLLLIAAIVGAVLAGFATIVSVGSAARRRSYETAALRAIGIPRAQLLAGAVLEQLLLLLAALVLGVPAGMLAAWLALPVIPEFATATPVALRFVPPLSPVLVFAAVVAAIVVAAAVLAGTSVLRASHPSRLREAEE